MIDTESGETAPLKPTTGQKARGLTALVVACAALSFFAGAAATNGLRTAAGPAELGGAHPDAMGIAKGLQDARAALSARETPPGSA